MLTPLGIHHVTAIASSPQRNADFYVGVLGLRLVKRTVNFDDPNTYHLYYGDETGRPGSILTFFPWPWGRPGRQGTGQIAVTSLSIAPASLGYWLERLIRHGIAHQGPARRFDEQLLAFKDVDGLMLELVAHPAASALPGWGGGAVPAEHAIRGVHAITIWGEEQTPTTDFLGDALGFRSLAEEGPVRRYALGDGGPGTLVDVRAAKGFWAGTLGTGTVHHVAFRAPDEAAQLDMRQGLLARENHVTGVLDRQYFRSVYFNEPGGVLFEIATDGPGFSIDEPLAALGDRLTLPPWLEPHRGEIEPSLPPLLVEVDARGAGDVAARGT